MIFVSGDFNAKSNNWCKTDTTSHEGSMIDAVTSNYGLGQLIQELTHILNSTSSCIDLIFTSRSILLMESGIHSSLHLNFHHQVVFAKLADSELIRRVINEFDWIRALSKVSVDKKFCYFTKTLLRDDAHMTP